VVPVAARSFGRITHQHHHDSGTPVIAVTCSWLVLERGLTSVSSIPLTAATGSVQHRFWFYSHPAVYIMILPSMV